MRTKIPSVKKVWFTSDLHLCHSKPFVYAARGFATVDEMNEKIIENLQAVVGEYDDLYILGDLTLGSLLNALPLLRRIPGRVHVIIGNHDTDNRIMAYKHLGWEVRFANVIKYGKYSFFLSHYPTNSSNPGENKLNLATINLYGHTHQETSWDAANPFAYHVGMDSHDCKPILLSDIIDELQENLQK